MRELLDESLRCCRLLTQDLSSPALEHGGPQAGLEGQPGIQMRDIQAILGHATITSTELYTHVSLEDLKEVVRRAHPHRKKE